MSFACIIGFMTWVMCTSRDQLIAVTCSHMCVKCSTQVNNSSKFYHAHLPFPSDSKPGVGGCVLLLPVGEWVCVSVPVRVCMYAHSTIRVRL